MSSKTISPEIRAMFLYVRAGILLFPVLVTFLFSHTFLMPKLRDLWAEAGIEASNASGVMAFADSLVHYFYPVLFVVVVVVALLELTVSAWRRFRSLCLDAVIFLIYCVTLLGVQLIAACALIASTMVVAKQ